VRSPADGRRAIFEIGLKTSWSRRVTGPWQAAMVESGAEAAGSSQRHPPRAGNALQGKDLGGSLSLKPSGRPNGLEMSRPASQG